MPRVEISCVDGDFTYSDHVCYVESRRQKTLEVTCGGDKPFALHIGWDSPFEKGRYRAKAGETMYLRLKQDPRPGEYKYFVAVCDPKTGEIWTDDPYFIIRP